MIGHLLINFLYFVLKQKPVKVANSRPENKDPLRAFKSQDKPTPLGVLVPKTMTYDKQCSTKTAAAATAVGETIRQLFKARQY